MGKASNLLNTVIQKATENIVSFVISLVLSTGLVGGSTYLLFGLRDDLHQLHLGRIEIEKAIETDRRDMEAIRSWTAPEHQHAQTFASLFDRLAQSKTVPQLEPQDARQLQGQVSEIVIDLTMLRGQIRGYQFSDDSRTRFQQSLLETLDSQIEIANALRALVQGWESFSIEERETCFRSVREKAVQQFEKQAQHQTVIQGAMAAHWGKTKDDEKQHAEITKLMTDLNRRLWLSGLGIVAGCSLLLFFVIRAFPGQFRIRRRRLG
ncbi:MAG TPA: hypothetical protein VGX03_32435 [Candidatus Binatia bacterium]|jgi:hypothetical protein|nr:hypothetical protein [Candidatus Binatia bacterium]